MIKVHTQDGVIWHPSGLSISSEPLAAYPYLRHASTTRDFSTPEMPRLQELLRFRQHLDAPASFLAFGEQKHTSNVAAVSDEIVNNNRDSGYWRFTQTDAIVCSFRNVSIAIQTADCAPVFLFDPSREVIAMAHAGWKGSLSRIVARTVEKMKQLDCSPADIIAWVGPMAGSCCYEVSEELVQKFQVEFSDIPADSVAHGRHLDLVEVNCHQLKSSGLQPRNIHRSNLCTIHQNQHFHSYRADEGTNGRIISGMVMLDKT